MSTKKDPVVVYSVDNCAPCDNTKKYLRQKNISFTVRDVKKNPSYNMDLLRMTGSRRVPVIVSGNTIIKGFNKTAIDKLN